MRGRYAASLMASATGWSPLDLTNLYAWYDPEQHTESNLGSIATLVDRSGNGRDFTQPTAGVRPFLRHGDVNGKKTIQLGETTAGTATPTYMDIGSSFLSGVTAAHSFYVARAAADPSTGGYDGAIWGEMEDFDSFSHVPYANGQIYLGLCSNVRKNANPYWELNQWHIFEEWSATNDWGVKINGHVVATSSSNTVSIANVGRKFGVGNAANDARYRGRFAQGIFANAKVNDVEAEKVRAYLAKSFGLTDVLPVGHLAKTFPLADRWRIRAVTTNGTNGAFGMRELQMYASNDASGPNLAVLGGGVTGIANYENGSYPISAAFNSNTDDFWTSLGTVPPTGGHWIGVQFPSPVSIRSFRVYTRADWNETPTSYVLEYSQDSGSTWKIISGGGAITGNTWVVLPIT